MYDTPPSSERSLAQSVIRPIATIPQLSIGALELGPDTLRRLVRRLCWDPSLANFTRSMGYRSVKRQLPHDSRSTPCEIKALKKTSERPLKLPNQIRPW